MKYIILLILFSLSASTSYPQNWYTFAGSNQKNGLTKFTGPVSTASPYWTVNSTNSTVWGNAVYTFGDKFATSRVTFSPSYRAKVELRNLTNGTLIWEKTVSDTARLFVVGFTEDAVYAADYQGAIGTVLYALTVDSGNVKWSIETEIFPGNSGICFAEDGDPIIFKKRLDRKTGVAKWVYNYYIPIIPNCGFVVKGNTYYHFTGTAITPKKLIAVDINTGAFKYESSSLPGDGDQENPLIIGPDGTIYITRDGSSNSSYLHAFTDNGTGFQQKWALSPAVLVKSFGPNNVLYCANVNYGSQSGKLMRVNGETGAVIDSVSSNIPGVYVTVGYDSTVYVATGEAGNGRYFAFTPDLQTIKWQLNTPYNYYSGCPLGREGIFITIGSGTQITAYKPSINRKPVADFRSNGRDITTSQTISFFDQSSYSPVSWQWTFDGGSPSTSNAQNPVNIAYSASGVYQVKLVVSNSFGSDTIIRSQYVHVSSSIGISNNGIEISSYKLEQNYPNPFNPVTKIEFNIAKSGFVKISVFDILGKEVAMPVNESLQPGTYETSFDASTLNSGIYFYRLETNGFVETRKMILLK